MNSIFNDDDFLCEYEHTMIFSIPNKYIHKNNLLLYFLHNASECAVWRETKISRTTWRIGKLYRINEKYYDTNPLRMIDHIESQPYDFFSLLKTTIFSHKIYHYDERLTFDQNNRYPHIIESKLALEIQLSRGNEILNSLLEGEDDCSDNNLGIKFIRRISFFCDNNIRISLRCILNEFHEISYRVEIECENELVNDDTYIQQINDVFERHLLGILEICWPNGYSDEFNIDLPCGEWLQSVCNYIKIKTGPSLLNRSNIIEYIEREPSICLKNKTDGIRSYGLFHNNILISEHRTIISQPICDNIRIPNGLFLFQLELTDYENYITEVCLIGDPLSLIRLGKRSIVRQIEESEYVLSKEQEIHEIGYVISERDLDVCADKVFEAPILLREIQRGFRKFCMFKLLKILDNLLLRYKTWENIMKFANINCNNVSMFDFNEHEMFNSLVEYSHKYFSYFTRKKNWISIDGKTSCLLLYELQKLNYKYNWNIKIPYIQFYPFYHINENLDDIEGYLLYKNNYYVEKIKKYQTIELLYRDGKLYSSNGLFGNLSENNNMIILTNFDGDMRVDRIKVENFPQNCNDRIIIEFQYRPMEKILRFVVNRMDKNSPDSHNKITRIINN